LVAGLFATAIIGRGNHSAFCLAYRRYRRAKHSFDRLLSLRTLSSGETFIRPFVSSTDAIAERNTHPTVYVINPAIIERNSRLAATCGGKLAITATTSVWPFDLYSANRCQITYRRYRQAKARIGTTAFSAIDKRTRMLYEEQL